SVCGPRCHSLPPHARAIPPSLRENRRCSGRSRSSNRMLHRRRPRVTDHQRTDVLVMTTIQVQLGTVANTMATPSASQSNALDSQFILPEPAAEATLDDIAGLYA